MVRAQGQSPENLARRVARRIAAVRLSKGLTQEALARTLGIATKNLQRLESGRQNLTLGKVEEVASALGVDADTLLTRPIDSAERDTWSSLIEAGIAVLPSEDAPPKSAVPVYSLAAAAGSLGSNRPVERLAWAIVPRLERTTGVQRFLARVAGRSMEPLIPDRAWYLFHTGVTGPLEGRIVLIQHRDIRDPETDGAYALKRLGGIEVDAEGVSVRLESLNPEHPTYRVRLNALEELRAIAEFVRVVGPQAASTGGRARRRSG